MTDGLFVSTIRETTGGLIGPSGPLTGERGGEEKKERKDVMMMEKEQEQEEKEKEKEERPRSLRLFLRLSTCLSAYRPSLLLPG